MAEIKRVILGVPSGRIGDDLYRFINGKTFVSKAVMKRNPCQLPHVKNLRKKQTVNGKFASVINKNYFLKTLWIKEKAPCTTGYNRINQVNYNLCESDHPSANAQITPHGGFKLEVKEITIRRNNIETAPRPVELKKAETAIAYILILSLWNPRKKTKSTIPFEFLTSKTIILAAPGTIKLLNKKSSNLQIVDPAATSLTFPLDKEEIARVKEYKNKSIFLAALTLDNKFNIRRWSETFVKEFS